MNNIKDNKLARLSIRIEKELLNAFHDTCTMQAVNASQLIRNYIKNYIEENRKA